MGQESKIEKTVKSYARSKGFYVRKFKSPGNRAVPDSLFLSPAGVVVFIEFKAPGKEPSPTQQREINEINKRNGRAYAVDSITKGKEIIDSILKVTVL